MKVTNTERSQFTHSQQMAGYKKAHDMTGGSMEQVMVLASGEEEGSREAMLASRDIEKKQ